MKRTTGRGSAARWLLATMSIVLVVGALAGCGDSNSSANADKTTTTVKDVPGTATVTSFVVPQSAECTGKTSTTVTVSYAVSGASKQELYVDGALVPGTDGASGSLTTPVHCDPLPHTFVMIAYDAKGRRTASEKKLTTNA